jgi:dTDP-4-amino-4,6-dideoxygalactose transaminase
MQFLDLKVQYKSIKRDIDNAIKSVLDNGVFIGGPEVENFENEVAKFCGTKFGISVNSGTDALYLSLKAMGIGEGDEVITTPFTFIATAEIISNCGAKPVFVDIEPETFNIDVNQIEKKITKKTKAIIPVHLFGQMADMAQIMKIAKKYKLKVIEDCAQAIGAQLKVNGKTKKAGSFGDAGCFSFFPSKNLGTFGDGGMIVTSDKKLNDAIRLIKNHGSSPKQKYLNLVLGVNSRLDAIQAAILRVKLRHLPKWSKQRREKADYYSKAIKKIEGFTPPVIRGDRNHIFHQYTVRAANNKRDKLVAYLNQNGVPTMVYYPLPLHSQPAMKYLGHKKGSFPGAEKASAEVFSLPIYPELSKKDQDFVLKTLKNFEN